MQTIVKFIIALLFSHISVSEPVEDKQEKVSKIQIQVISKSNSCATLQQLNQDNII